MNKHKRDLIGLLLILFALAFAWWVGIGPAQAKPTHQLPPVIIADSNFNHNDWQETIISQVGAASYRVEQLDNPPATYRRIWHSLPAITGNELAAIGLAHLYQGQIYDPAIEGPIDFIEYTERHRLSISPHPNAVVQGQFVIVQNGTTYLSQAFDITSPEQRQISLTNLKPSDFNRYSEGGSLYPDFTEQGVPLTFGFMRWNFRNGASPLPGEPVTYGHDILTWKVTIHQAEGYTGRNHPPVAVPHETVVPADRYLQPDGSLFIDKILVTLNDYDPDGDPIHLIAAGALHGVTNINGNGLSVSYRTANPTFEPEQISYTISDGELSDSTTDILFFDCGCFFNCYYGLPTPLTAPTDSVDVGLIYRLRDQVMKPTVDGNRYVEMYYTTTPEIARILMLTQPDLGQEAVRVVEVWQDNLSSLVDGDGNAVVTQAQVEAIKTFLANLRAAGSSDLQQVIDTELARLGPLDDYVGLTVAEAKTKAIGTVTAPAGNTVYLPLIFK